MGSFASRVFYRQKLQQENHWKNPWVSIFSPKKTPETPRGRPGNLRQVEAWQKALQVLTSIPPNARTTGHFGGCPMKVLGMNEERRRFFFFPFFRILRGLLFESPKRSDVKRKTSELIGWNWEGS